MAGLHDETYGLFVQMLANKRRAARLTQQAVADALGWQQSYIAKIETQQRRVDIVELVRLAGVIGFDPARLVRDLRAAMIERGEIPPPGA